MRWIAKGLLWLVTILSPVFIAACYGVGVSFNCFGKVVDAVSGEAVSGVRVSCMQGETVLDETTSDLDGTFSLYSTASCDQIIFDDPEERYADASLSENQACGGTDVQLDLLD